MSGRKIALRIIILAIGAAALTGCGEELSGQSIPGTEGITETETAESSGDVISEPPAGQSAESAVQSSAGQSAESAVEPPAGQPAESELEPSAEQSTESELEPPVGQSEQTRRSVPALPAMGSKLSDFVPEGWELMDSVELDYNGDGITDYVGVQEVPYDEEKGGGRYDSADFRILFAIASEGPGQYRLDFQNENLIHTWDEGGPFGDPYEPLTAEGNSFTTSAYGGSAWKWSETYTYTYRDGTWYLTWSEELSMFGRYIVDDVIDDWEKGVRTRKIRSEDFDKDAVWMMEDAEMEAEGYDLEYELRLDEPLTLYQAGKRWGSAPDRVTDWEVREIVLAEGIELSREMIETSEKSLRCYDADYDENGVLYTFCCGGQGEQQKLYLAMYRRQDKSLHVLAEEEGSFVNNVQVYGDRIYYSAACGAAENGENAEKEDGVVYRLNRINMDGTEKESIFETSYGDLRMEIMDICGGEIIVEVYKREEPNPVYRMDADGGNLRQIGQIPRE